MTPLYPTRRSLEGERFQVIVIGGGANGAAIARECAKAGRRVLLVEQNDFGSGATFTSGRIVPGGLRQVEERNLGAARSSLREQDVLIRSYPHQVRAMEFLLAVAPESSRGSLKTKSALWLYKQMQTSHFQSEQRTSSKKLQSLLPDGRRWSVFSYEDAVCAHPERLVAAWVAEAVEFGGEARNYCQALAVDIRHGRAQGVLLRDQLSGREERVGATWVINAAGPWAERLCQRSRVEIRAPLLSTVRATHIVLPTFSGAPCSAIAFEGPGERQFVLAPWNGQLLLGQTEVADRGDPAKVSPGAQDMDVLLNAFHGLFPSLQTSRHDVRFAFSGHYAKPAGDSSGYSSTVQDHTADGAANLFSVVGGTLATALRVARECAVQCGGARKNSENESAHDPAASIDHSIMVLRDAARVNEETATCIAEWHGKRSQNIAELAASDARMRSPLCSHSDHIVAEAVDAYRGQFAVSLADILLRRVPVALGACWSQSCSRDAVTRLSAVMGWSEQQAAAELEAFEVERSRVLPKPSAARLHAMQTAAD